MFFKISHSKKSRGRGSPGLVWQTYDGIKDSGLDFHYSLLNVLLLLLLSFLPVAARWLFYFCSHLSVLRQKERGDTKT